MSWKKLVTSGSDISQLNNDVGYVTSLTGSFDIDAFPDGTGITVASSDKILLSDAGTEKYIEVRQLDEALNLDSMASQSKDSVNIDGGDIASGVTINKSPVVNFNSGDVQGSLTLTNLASGTGGLTIQAGAVEHSMLNSTVISAGTAYSSDLVTLDQFLVDINGTGLRRVNYGVLSSSLAGDGFGGGAGDVVGPVSSTDNAIARYDSTTGKIIQNSGVIIDDSNNITGVNDLTVGGEAVVTGNLTVNGTTTFINTSNLLVEDRFVLLASGSAGGDGGIIIESSENLGHALFWDDSADRWALKDSLSATATTAAPDAYIGVIQTGGSDPASNPTYGGTSGDGTIFINISDESIWIFS